MDPPQSPPPPNFSQKPKFHIFSFLKPSLISYRISRISSIYIKLHSGCPVVQLFVRLCSIFQIPCIAVHYKCLHVLENYAWQSNHNEAQTKGTHLLIKSYCVCLSTKSRISRIKSIYIKLHSICLFVFNF